MSRLILAFVLATIDLATASWLAADERRPPVSPEAVVTQFQQRGYELGWSGGAAKFCKVTDVTVDGDELKIRYDWSNGVLAGKLNGSTLRGTCTQDNGICAFHLKFAAEPSSAEGWWADSDGTRHNLVLRLGIVGKWKWFDDQTVTVANDGTLSSTKGHHGKWEVASEKAEQRKYKLEWVDIGSTDSLDLSGDGRKLAGRNQNGLEISADRDMQSASGGKVKSAAVSPVTGDVWCVGHLFNPVVLRIRYYIDENGRKHEIQKDFVIDGKADPGSLSDEGKTIRASEVDFELMNAFGTTSWRTDSHDFDTEGRLAIPIEPRFMPRPKRPLLVPRTAYEKHRELVDMIMNSPTADSMKRQHYMWCLLRRTPEQAEDLKKIYLREKEELSRSGGTDSPASQSTQEKYEVVSDETFLATWPWKDNPGEYEKILSNYYSALGEKGYSELFRAIMNPNSGYSRKQQYLMVCDLPFLSDERARVGFGR